MSILRDLYYGEIKLSEKYVKNGSKYYKMSEKLSDDIDNFIKLLNAEEYEFFDRILDSMLQIGGICDEECFTKGFCTGAKMMLEILNFKSDNFNDF